MGGARCRRGAAFGQSDLWCLDLAAAGLRADLPRRHVLLWTRGRLESRCGGRVLHRGPDPRRRCGPAAARSRRRSGCAWADRRPRDARRRSVRRPRVALPGIVGGARAPGPAGHRDAAADAVRLVRPRNDPRRFDRRIGGRSVAAAPPRHPLAAPGRQLCARAGHVRGRDSNPSTATCSSPCMRR